MADLVLGIGTSHGPMLVTEPDSWGARVPADKAATHAWRSGLWTFDALVEERGSENLAAQILPEMWEARHRRCQAAIRQLADIFAQSAIDIAVIVGNDQMEIFDERLIPAFAVHHGDTITNHAFSPERMARLPVGVGIAVPGYIPPGGADYPGHPPLARHIITHLGRDGFDLASMNALPKSETPHAFGFVFRHLMRDCPVPSVMLTVNTFYPPNQPSVSRCYELGKSLFRAIANWQSDARVALIASGGLSHFVIDEQLDALFLESLRTGDMRAVVELDESIFQDGTSELKNWIPLAGAMRESGLAPRILDYVPCYRSEAGTGNAMGFVYWS